MKIVIFGTGPMPCEPHFAVTAPGARTWQITQTVSHALLQSDPGPHCVTVYGLEGNARHDAFSSLTLHLSAQRQWSRLAGPSPTPEQGCVVHYIPQSYETFLASASAAAADSVDAVVGCASAQPYATAAHFASRHTLPLWIDIFGDPFCEIQSKAEIYDQEQANNDQRYQHVWRLVLPALLQADVLSALSERQRHGVLGQLGVAGRLNRLTAGQNFVHTLPYGLFPEDFPPLSPAPAKTNFIVAWCGSFNTWMDVDSLVEGVARAIKANPRLRLLVIGGKIAGYNEVSYERFVQGIRAAGVDKAVQLVDWKPLGEIQKLYALADVGLSIDRFTYEAETGSRTRIVNFLAAAKPVLSTVVTELTEELAAQGFVLPFRLNDASDLARALQDACQQGAQMHDLGLRGRQYVASRFSAWQIAQPLVRWITHPAFAPDKDSSRALDPGNPLTAYWQRVFSALQSG